MRRWQSDSLLESTKRSVRCCFCPIHLCIEQCTLGWLKHFTLPVTPRLFLCFYLTRSRSLSFALLSCDAVTFCFYFCILAGLLRDCSGFIRVHSAVLAFVLTRLCACHVSAHIPLSAHTNQSVMDIHTYIHTYIHTFMHTYIHRNAN